MKLRDIVLGTKEKVDVLLLDVEERETKTKKPYVIFRVTDGENVVSVRKWDCRATDYKKYKGNVVNMNIRVGTYGGEATYDVDTISSSEKEVQDFIQKVPGDVLEMYQEILNHVDSIQDLHLRALISEILKDQKEKFLYWAAAKGVHHALYGGLIYHVYRMGKNVDLQCQLYPDLNRDLMIAGTYLHDIGKLKELETDILGASKYTTIGNMLGHLYIGAEIVSEYNQKMEEPVDEEILLQLKHMILSHHGKKEWGAVVEPKTIEAQMLHLLDLLDSRMYIFEDAYKNAEPGVATNPIFGIGTSVYKFN